MRRESAVDSPAEISEKITFFQRRARMWDTCAVELRVSLPEPVAAELEEVQRTDPEMLNRILVYGLMRRAIFEELSRGREEGRL